MKKTHNFKGILFTLLAFLIFSSFFTTSSIVWAQVVPTPISVGCGQTYQGSNYSCTCPTGSSLLRRGNMSPDVMCCGVVSGSSCLASAGPTTGPGTPTVGPGTIVPTPDDPIDPFEGVSSKTFDTLNPLKIGGSDSDDVTVFEESQYVNQLSKPGLFINRFLWFAFPIASLILFVMIVAGGFQILAGATSKKSIEEGRKRVVAAIVGFMLLFSSYWIIQIIEKIFGLNIFNS